MDTAPETAGNDAALATPAVQREAARTLRRIRRPDRNRWFAPVLCALLVVAGLGVYFNGNAAANARDAAVAAQRRAEAADERAKDAAAAARRLADQVSENEAEIAAARAEQERDRRYAESLAEQVREMGGTPVPGPPGSSGSDGRDGRPGDDGNPAPTPSATRSPSPSPTCFLPPPAPCFPRP